MDAQDLEPGRNRAMAALFDRLLTLSTGALTLSIAFREAIGGSAPVALGLLRLAWLAFCAPILGAVLYHVFDFHLYNRAIDKLRQGRSKFEVNNGCLVLPLAYASLAGFSLGLLALLLFALRNLD